MGITAGVVIGLGTVAGVQAATSDGSAGNRKVIVSPQQLKINQRISQAAVKRSNDALKNLATLNAQVPLFAVSSGAVGSNLVRGRGALAPNASTTATIASNSTATSACAPGRPRPPATRRRRPTR